ncbi:MAG: hypothetical protein NXI08_17130 [bacterium]|nr:hypothetical protein [bacterium]
MTTPQSLEFINPYAKFGLKRRPTYEEIVGLIGENDLITGKLPNRDATFFKASPQGSFFDGSDHIDLLKDQEMRILDRQMREAMMKQEARRNGRTYAVHRMNADAPLTRNAEAIEDEYVFSTPLQTSRQREAVVDTRLQELTAATKERVNEVSQAMASNLRDMGGTIFHKMLGNRTSAPSATARTVPDNLPVSEYEGSPISGGDDAQVEYQATGAPSSTAQQPPPLSMTPIFIQQ